MKQIEEGELIVWEEEGGYTSPFLGIKTDAGEVSFEEIIERFSVKMDGGNQGPTGLRIRITIETI